MIRNLELLNQGKVRDIYGLFDDHLLVVTSDRISVFDVVLPDPIPGKGIILNQISNFWFNFFQNEVMNQFHEARYTFNDLPLTSNEHAEIVGRASIVRKLNVIPFECIVRGYIIGSGWKDYQKTGAISGHQLPAGLELADELPFSIFTPSTKAEQGAHDENVSFDYMAKEIGAGLAGELEEISIHLYDTAARFMLTKGIILADTKFEFALDENDNIVLIDEVLTPDSSRYWNAFTYQVGKNPESYDKQFVRDYMESQDWNKKPPAPRLPQEVIDKTYDKYKQILKLLTNEETAI